MSFPTGGTGFQNPIVGGGGELVISNIHSRDFESGVQGWRISRNGDAEFSGITIRGIFIARDGDNEVRISPSNPPWTNEPAVSLNPQSFVYAPGLIQGGDTHGDETVGDLYMRSPYPINSATLAAEGDPSVIQLFSDVRGTFASRFIQLTTDTVNVSRDLTVDRDISVNGDLTLFATNGTGNVNVVAGDVNVSAGLVRSGLGGLTAFTFVNGWGDFGGQFVSCAFGKTATGLGFIVGTPSGGTTTSGTAITQLPTDYIPAESHTFLCTANGARSTQCVVRGMTAPVAERGNVVIQSPDVGLTWFSLAGMTWPLPDF